MKVISFLLLGVIFSACSSNKPEVIDQKKDPIRWGINSKRDEFRSCYLESESYKGKDAETKGFIEVGFIINQAGAVKESRIMQSSFDDANLDACILGILRGIKFPKSKDAMAVRQPINFYPRTDD